MVLMENKIEITVGIWLRGPSVTRNMLLLDLFAQDWPNLRWGRFNNVEFDSINTLQVTVLVPVTE